MHYLFGDTNLLFEFLSRVRVVCVNDSCWVNNIHLVVHLIQTHKIFIVVVRGRVAMFADCTAKYYVSKWVSCCLHFTSAVYEMMWMLCCIYRVKHNGEISTGRIFHSAGYVKTTGCKSVLLIFHRTGTDCYIG